MQCIYVDREKKGAAVAPGAGGASANGDSSSSSSGRPLTPDRAAAVAAAGGDAAGMPAADVGVSGLAGVGNRSSSAGSSNFKCRCQCRVVCAVWHAAS
jgi:hypothetical protein